MIDLYTWSTPNGRKVSIMLEELELEYNAIPINIGKGEQFDASFIAISPNNKIPAIVDHDSGATLMESGAILLYLAEKTGKLLSSDPATRWKTIEWLMWQMGGLGPMAGQALHFVKFNPGKAPYAEERYVNETKRLYGVLETQLAQQEFVVGDYSIADIAIWPWIAPYEAQTIDLNSYPNIKRWYLGMVERKAVQKGYQIPQYVQDIPKPA